jgi:hypothetical protein
MAGVAPGEAGAAMTRATPPVAIPAVQLPAPTPPRELLASLTEENRRLHGQVEYLTIALQEERRRGRRMRKALAWLRDAVLGRRGAALTEATAATTQVLGDDE